MVDSSKVVHVWVARRSFDTTVLQNWKQYIQKYLKKGELAHSAILAKTDNGRFYIVEYMDTGKAQNFEVNKMNDQATEFNGGTNKQGQQFYWKKQKIGTNVANGPSIAQLTQTMQSLQDKYGSTKQQNKYDVMINNCHMGQERTRVQYGWAQENICDYQAWLYKTADELQKLFEQQGEGMLDANKFMM